ncbi:hypothetical protein WMF26_31705 [Sorangium sp. So ce185]
MGAACGSSDGVDIRVATTDADEAVAAPRRRAPGDDRIASRRAGEPWPFR